MAAAETEPNSVPARFWAGFEQSLITAFKYSLRGRVTLATGMLFCVSLAVVCVQSLAILRDELRSTIIEHNEAYLSSLSEHLATDLTKTHQHLSDFASVFPRPFLSDPDAANAFLATRVGLARIFEGGLRLYSASGREIANSPDAANEPRSAVESDALRAIIATDQPQISEPYVRPGERSGPKVAFFATIKTAGQTAGILEGILNLDGHNIVAALPHTRLGKAGYVFLADRQGRIIAHPDAQRLLTHVPEPSASTAIARLSAGQMLSGETPTAQGGSMLTSIRRLPITGWLVGINLPEVEVYSPVRLVERYVILGALITFALLLLAMIWTMRLLMKPLERITEQVRAISQSGHTKGQRILFRSGPKELTTLADGFNDMLQSLERHREALARRERRFRTLIEDSSDIIAVMNDDGTLTFVSPSVSALGYSADEIIGRSALEFVHPEETDAAQAAMKRVLEDPQRGEKLDRRIIQKDGSLRQYEMIIRNRLADPNIRGIVLSARDVSERRAAEDAVRLEEQRLRVALACANVVAFNQDADLRYTWCVNSHFFSSPDEVVGKTDAELFPADYASLSARLKRRVLETAKSERSEVTLAKDGREHAIILAVEPLCGANGEVSGVVGAAMDITDQRQTEQMLRNAQRMESLGNLTGGIAHDFNNFLGVILANLECIRAATSETENVQRFVDNALTAANHGARLTGNLLAFARQQSLEPEPLDLKAVLDTFTDMLRPAIGQGVTLDLDVAQNLWTCLADADQLQNVILNLVVNARDAMPDGGRLIIRARNVTNPKDAASDTPLVPDGDFVEVSVVDSGHGMTADVAGRAFEPFFTTKEIGRGTGLGLSMVYGFARQSGGHVTITSRIDAGTTVSVYLPRTVPSSPRHQEGSR